MRSILIDKISRIIISCSAIIFLFPSICFSRIVTVSSYKELRTACQNALSNDTIMIKKGVYTITDRAWIDIDNRPGPVLVKGETDNPKDVVIRGLGMDNENMIINFNLNNCPKWTFENLTTSDSYYHGFKFDLASTDCVLRNIIMLDHGESGVKGTSNPSVGTYPDRLLVENCIIGFTNSSGGTRPNVEGIDGVAVNDWIIRGCTFINIQRYGEPAYACFTKGYSSNTIIENNLFINCLVGASFGGGGSPKNIHRDYNDKYEHLYGIIRNNIFIRCTDAAIYVNDAYMCKIYNNTIYECMLTIQLRFSTTSGFVCNNLVLPSPENPDEQIVRSRDGGVILRNQGNRKGNYSDFVNGYGTPEQLNLRLKEGAFAIDIGVDIGNDVLYDFDRKPRPSGHSIDVGAFEFQFPINTFYDKINDINNVIININPNPFSQSTIINYQTSIDSYVSLKIFDTFGNIIATLVDGELEAGEHSVVYNANDLPSGVYFYQLRAGNITETKQLLLIK